MWSYHLIIWPFCKYILNRTAHGSGGLTHWCWVMHLCVCKLTSIGSDNGLSPGRRQAITSTNVRILLIGPLGINFSEILIEIHTFSFKKIHLKMLFGKWQPFCLGLNVLTHWCLIIHQFISALCAGSSLFLPKALSPVKLKAIKLISWICILVFPVKFPSGECHKIIRYH